MSDIKEFRADLGRSVRLLRAFRTEQTSPEEYYTALARDTVSQLGQYADLDGSVVADVGGTASQSKTPYRLAPMCYVLSRIERP